MASRTRRASTGSVDPWTSAQVVLAGLSMGVLPLPLVGLALLLGGIVRRLVARVIARSRPYHCPRLAPRGPPFTGGHDVRIEACTRPADAAAEPPIRGRRGRTRELRTQPERGSRALTEPQLAEPG